MEGTIYPEANLSSCKPVKPYKGSASKMQREDRYRLDILTLRRRNREKSKE